MANIKLPDLDMRNILHVVRENFERVKRKAFAIRMMYIGEHGTTKEMVIRNFHKSVKFTNAGYTDVPVNGILLVYDSYFVHILEGSEDTLNRQLRFLFNIEVHWKKKMTRIDEESVKAAALAAEEAAAEANIIYVAEPPAPLPERVMFRRLKMLMVYHSITTLHFNRWGSVIARPPSLVGTLDVYGPLSEHVEQMRVCLDKLTKLIDLWKFDPNLSFDGLSANDPKMEALPEVALLDFLLQSQYTLDLREVNAMHRRVPDYMFYFEHVWPLQSALTPRYLYKLKIDDSFVEPLPIMPWEMKDEEDEEREDGKSRASSSSD